MTTGQPWSKFYWADWRSDPKLKICSLAARGLWMEMLCLMHEAKPRGYLLIGSNPPTDAQLAALVGAPSEQIPDLLGELASAGVFSRSKEGVIYSRRMTDEGKKAAISRKNGRLGGNPTLRKQKEISAWDNPKVNPDDKTQKPEARSQIPEKENNYAFEGAVVRLSWPDFTRWTTNFRHIHDLRAELQRLDDYYARLPAPDRGDWFMRASGALAKLNRQQAERDGAPGPPPGPRRVSAI